MIRRVAKIVLCVVVTIVSLPLAAQFYSNGASPSGIRWQSHQGESVRVIAPDFAKGEARRVLFMMDSLTNHIYYGLGENLSPLGSPVVLHANSAASNGISIMAPRRIEMCVMPTTDSYATPWLRQLSVHEYRHAAQYAALFKGAARWPYYFLGESGLLLLTGTLPFWWLEGDAVDAETQASLFGRALQPSFTMHYRAVGRDILEGKNHDLWFSGSYNRKVPSHYELGYQMVTTANTLKGSYAWGEVIDYASRRFWTITPVEWGMRRHLGYSTKELFETTFRRLNDHWDTLPLRESTATRVALSNPRHNSPYVTYQYPLWVDDNFIVATKTSFDTPTEMVEIDLAWGHERRLFHIGNINTRPALVGEDLYWTEIRQLSSFAQEMGSVMYRAPRDGSARPERVKEVGDYVLYPTEFEGELAWVRYNLDGTYSIVCSQGEITLPEGMECHGLTANGNRLYYIATAESGISIQCVEPATWRSWVTKPASRVTISNLVASNGKLYFGSIASGYDEIHCIDLSTGREERITNSPYGAFDGAPSPDGQRVALTDYDASGYHLAIAPHEAVEVVSHGEIPRNVVNAEVYRWKNFPCIDTIHYGAREALDMRDSIPTTRFSKVGNMIEPHSWAPIYYRPEQLVSGNLLDVRLGITATSQSLLSDATTTLGLFYLPEGHIGINLNFKYIGLAPKFDLNASVRNGTAPVAAPKGVMMRGGDYHASYDHTEEEIAPPSPTTTYYSFYGRVHLPIILSHSYWTSVLTPSVELSHSNAQLYSPTTKSYSNGQTLAAATLQWNNYTRSAYRNLQPQWGFALIGGVGKTLSTMETPTTIGLFTRAYTPAFGANDGFTWKASYQGLLGSGPLGYAVNFGWLEPRGLRTTVYPDDQIGVGLQYDTPLLYPDRGIGGIVLLKRVRASLFVESLQGRLWMSDGRRVWQGATTFGGDIWLDTSWLRLPSQGDLSFRLGCYFDAKEVSKPTFSAGFGVNF